MATSGVFTGFSAANAGPKLGSVMILSLLPVSNRMLPAGVLDHVEPHRNHNGRIHDVAKFCEYAFADGQGA